MLIFYFENIEDFFHFLNRRTMNEIFYELVNSPDTSATTLALHFLGSINDQTVLYETLVEVRGEKKADEIIAEIKSTLDSIGEIKMIHGKIREIFMSLS
ncbi:MAG TPA: hypothetical protein VKK79_09845 [Candidatus Lokiarchaeia archaeon]|nr:hypothetical protein [Candidatus Lokiarchaeia archaeon]